MKNISNLKLFYISTEKHNQSETINFSTKNQPQFVYVSVMKMQAYHNLFWRSSDSGQDVDTLCWEVALVVSTHVLSRAPARVHHRLPAVLIQHNQVTLLECQEVGPICKGKVGITFSSSPGSTSVSNKTRQLRTGQFQAKTGTQTKWQT